MVACLVIVGIPPGVTVVPQPFQLLQKAFKSILEGEPIVGVRFRYDYDLETYLQRHMWDD